MSNDPHVKRRLALFMRVRIRYHDPPKQTEVCVFERRPIDQRERCEFCLGLGGSLSLPSSLAKRSKNDEATHTRSAVTPLYHLPNAARPSLSRHRCMRKRDAPSEQRKRQQPEWQLMADDAPSQEGPGAAGRGTGTPLRRSARLSPQRQQPPSPAPARSQNLSDSLAAAASAPAGAGACKTAPARSPRKRRKGCRVPFPAGNVPKCLMVVLQLFFCKIGQSLEASISKHRQVTCGFVCVWEDGPGLPPNFLLFVK